MRGVLDGLLTRLLRHGLLRYGLLRHDLLGLWLMRDGLSYRHVSLSLGLRLYMCLPLRVYLSGVLHMGLSLIHI